MAPIGVREVRQHASVYLARVAAGELIEITDRGRLVVAEVESEALAGYLRGFPDDVLFTAALARTELLRAVADGGVTAIADARSLLDDLDTVALSRSLLDQAGTLPPMRLRMLDAIHLAAAQRAGPSLRAVVTYDTRMVEAATALGMPAVGPA